MKAWKICYGITGVALAVSVAATGTYGLSEENREIYETALSLQQRVDGLGFSEFNLADYKVRFFDGDADYVVYGEAISREKPVFTTFVGTSYEVDGEYQVILPVLENFAEMFALLGAAETLSEGGVSFDKNTYGDQEHTATLWHEAFHAYQMTHYAEGIDGLRDGGRFEEGMSRVIVEAVDSRKDMIQYFERGAALLLQAYQETDMEAKKALVHEYFELESRRREQLGEEAVLAEDYLETVEGSACYVESCIIAFLKGQEEMEQHYMAPFSYSGGTGKYYKIGMMKCYLLEQLRQDWNAGYEFDRNLNELLRESCFETQ